jgi:hypothetical protein
VQAVEGGAPQAYLLEQHRSQPGFRCGDIAAASGASKRDTRRWFEQIHIFEVA